MRFHNLFMLMEQEENARRDITPSDLFNPALWLRPESLTGANGSAVSLWTDSSGSGRNASQATVANQALKIDNQLNGYPVVRFDGSNDFYIFSGWNTNYTNFTIIILHKPTARTTFQVLFGKTGGDSYNTLQTSGVPYIQGSPSIFASAAPALNQFSILQAEAEGTSIRHFLNNVANGTGTTTRPSSANNWRIGSSGVEAITGDIAEILFYDKILSNTQRDFVDTYLKNKYNL